jgi:hypothetical protein
MKKTIVLFIGLALFSCNQKIEKNDIPKINGYWEIEKVVLPDGKEKEYKINETIDYFQVKGNKGFRKKVMPQFDGTYLVNDQKEDIVIFEKKGDFFIEYTTPYGKWKEQLLEISADELVLKNQQNLEYHYKKPIPFSIK